MVEWSSGSQDKSMVSSKVFTRACLTLMLYLASEPSLAQSESNLQMNTKTLNTTYWGNPNPIPDPRYPSFISNVLRGLSHASIIAGHQVPLIEIVTALPTIRASSSVGDFTSIQLFVLIASTAEIACLSSRQPWGAWDLDFRYKEPVSPGQYMGIPIWALRGYDQWKAFRALPASFGPWLIVFLRVGIVAHRPELIWFFGNGERDRCALVFRDPDDVWHVHIEPLSVCGSYIAPANVSIPLTFLLDENNANLSSTSSNLLPSAAGTNATQVAVPMRKLDGFNETDGDYQLVATN